jgi:hypothetical protein
MFACFEQFLISNGAVHQKQIPCKLNGVDSRDGKNRTLRNIVKISFATVIAMLNGTP